MSEKRFTLDAVEWQPWLPPVTTETATLTQRAALARSPQANSPYFLTLANDVESLDQRSPLFHAVMYAPGGLKRAERELATVVVSIINGCVYCSSVHARRFVELTKRPEVIRALYEQGLDTKLEPRLRAIVDYAARLTREPAAMTVADLAPLRAVGMDDLEIHDLINAVAMFANANRLMQTLGEPVFAGSLRLIPFSFAVSPEKPELNAGFPLSRMGADMTALTGSLHKPPGKPRRRGFGSRLIERGLSQDLACNARLDFVKSGLVCKIDAELSEVAGIR